jgi:hypothetical protein
MKVANLQPDVIERIKQIRYDRIVEKHEGPWDYAGDFRFRDPEFMQAGEWWVLLPVDGEQRPNITFLRTIISADGSVLTIFLHDTTYYGDDPFSAGYVAICERFPGADFYVATVYHEWFIFENPTLK